MYGDLEVADGQYGGSKGRRWKVDWSKTPQPIQVKLKCLRAVKDKLPGRQKQQHNNTVSTHICNPAIFN